LYRRGCNTSLVCSSDYRQLIRNLWDIMRLLGSTWPDEPTEVRSRAECGKAVDLVVAWCDEQGEAETSADENAGAKPDAAELAAQKVEWTEPEGPLQWAQIFRVSYKTMKNWLDKQVILNQQLSPRRYRIARKELPTK
jgi:hypothetical protein